MTRSKTERLTCAGAGDIGVGMVASVEAGDGEEVPAVLTREGETVMPLGEVVRISESAPRVRDDGQLALEG